MRFPKINVRELSRFVPEWRLEPLQEKAVSDGEVGLEESRSPMTRDAIEISNVRRSQTFCS